jgi:hypothetical protein
VLALTHSEGIVVALTLVSSIIAALAASAGTVITWRGNKEAMRQQRQMAADVRRLAELTENSIEEARALKPDPVVLFDVKGSGSAEPCSRASAWIATSMWNGSSLSSGSAHSPLCRSS